VWVVVGLGNPGVRYRRTPHNVGFRVLDRLAAHWHVEVGREAHHAVLGEAHPHGERVLLVKPQTFMNASGRAVASLQRYYRFDIARLIAVHDDVDLAPGRVRVRVGGGAGGHHGIESLLAELDDSGFVRVKVGVGRPPTSATTADFLLSPLPAEHAAVVSDAEARAAVAVDMLVSEGPERTMNRINQREGAHGGSPL
jgi:peptidyl-tRNA hydrolase, PTH1 family